MVKYVNDIGCAAEFDEALDPKIVAQRLSWLPGKNWRRVE